MHFGSRRSCLTALALALGAAPAVGGSNTQVIYSRFQGSDVKVEVRSDERVYGPGQNVYASLIVTNMGAEAIRLEFLIGCQAVLRVEDPAGTLLHLEYATTESCLIGGLTYLSLEPGQSHAYTFKWDRLNLSGDPVIGPVRLTVNGTLLSDQVLEPSDATSILLDPPCLDRLDNDGDLLIDYPEDPGCAAPGDFDETTPRPTQEGAIRTDRPAYYPGQSIKIAFDVSNPGTEPISYVTQQTCLTGIRVETLDRVVVSYVCGDGCGDAITIHTLQPGETRTTVCSWAQVDGQGLPVATPDELVIHGYLNLPFSFPDDTLVSTRILVGPACLDRADNEADGWADYLEDPGCAAPSDRDEVPAPDLTITPEGLSWSLVPGAEAYDVVWGDLLDATWYNGDFTYFTLGCLANDVSGGPIPPTPEPLPGEVRWFLVRPIVGGVAGTYDSSPATQVGWRDAEIEATGLGCP